MNCIDSNSRVDEGATVGSCRINRLLLVDGLLLLASFQQRLQHAHHRFSAACDQAGMKTSTKRPRCCCDRKSRAAYAQSFALWQQATIEFTCHDHSSRTLLLRSVVDIVSITRNYTPWSLYYCLFAPHMNGVVLHAHPVRGKSHNQRSTTGEVAIVLCLVSVCCK